MIPILFESGTTSFNTNGLGRLADCIRCIVTEERNGIYECEFDYPITGKLFPEITLGRIVACTHDETGDEQPFIIYRRSIPDLRGVVTFYAHHISYMLNDIVVKPYTASSVALALQNIKNYSANANPFTFWTDKETTATFKSKVPRNARAMLGGEENSILDVFGTGEYEFDKFTVKLYQSRGIDSGVEIYYGKNLVQLSQDIDNSGTYNAIVPYWADTEGYILMLPEVIISYAEEGERVDAAPMDLSDQFETMPTAAQLRAAARSRYESGDSWLPTENIKVDFVQLWQTEEYKQFAALQRVSLCDTVSVIYLDAGIERIKQKVIRTEYNVLLERYDSMELGTLQATLGEQIKQNVLETVPTTSMMEEAIQYATEMIRGGLGGYVVMTPGDNGYPQEILIMDTPDKNTARNVWRFNRGGLGHSSNGYNGPYSDIALTSDGRINASMITTGILNANVIRAGVISDYYGDNYWDLEAGEFVTQRGAIADWTIDGYELVYAPTTYRETTLSGENGFSSYYCRQYKEDFYNNYYLNQGFKLGNAYNGVWLEFRGSATTTPRTSMPGILYSFGIQETFGGLTDTVRQDLVILDKNGDRLMAWWTDRLNCQQITYFQKNVTIFGNLSVSGTKSRDVKTKNYNNRLLYAYETPTPLFGDIGEAVLDEDGICFVDIDDIFTETVADRVEYQVFLQAEGEGTCYVADKTPRYFVINGTPNLKVAWELKAKQKDYETYRLEPDDTGLDEYESPTDPLSDIDINQFIQEQEDILYG